MTPRIAERTAEEISSVGACCTRSWRRTAAGLVVAGLALAGCESNMLKDFGNFDPDADKSRTDYEEIFEARPADETTPPPPPIPELQPIISTSFSVSSYSSRRRIDLRSATHSKIPKIIEALATIQGARRLSSMLC